MGKVLGIGHVAINVQDEQATRQFYAGLLGLSLDRPIRLKDGVCLTYATLPDGSRLEFFTGKRAETRPATREERELGLRHLAFRVRGIEKLRDRLTGAGVEIVLDLTTLPELGMRVLLFTDPNGVTLELVEPLEDPEAPAGE